MTEAAEGDGHIGLGTAVSGLKGLGLDDFPVMGRGKPKQDLSQGDEMLPHPSLCPLARRTRSTNSAANSFTRR